MYLQTYYIYAYSSLVHFQNTIFNYFYFPFVKIPIKIKIKNINKNTGLKNNPNKSVPNDINSKIAPIPILKIKIKNDIIIVIIT